MEEQKKPTLDFDALAALSAEERTAAIAAYAAEVEASATAAADAKYSGELQDARYASAKYKLAMDGGLSGFGERMDAIEEILASTPVLHSLSDEDKLTVSRARKIQRFLSQPFTVSEKFIGIEGKYVPLAETIRGFKEIIEGKHDDIPESYFLNAGSIDDVLARVK